MKARVLRLVRTEEAKHERRKLGDNGGLKFGKKYYDFRPDNVCNTISTVDKDNILFMNASSEDIIYHLDHLEDGEQVRLRKFTPREIGRLMGVREDKIDIMLSSGVSYSSLYQQFGNSIVVDCMVGLFNGLFYKENNKMKKGDQLTFDMMGDW